MNQKVARWIAILFFVLLVNTAYVGAFASPTIFYVTNSLIHIGLGAVVFVGFLWVLSKNDDMREGTRFSYGLFVIAAVLAVFLCLGPWIPIAGNITRNRWAFWGHVCAASLGVIALVPYVIRKSKESAGWMQFRKGFTYALGFAILFPLTTGIYRGVFPNPDDRIVNPLIVPTEMAEEGGGPHSPFYPSSAKTNVGGIIPSEFFMDSAQCGECHKDIYEQWNSSAHHFASFNNQFYRKAIEYMQDVTGTQPSKWCAGCHDHAVFFNGRFDKPIKEQIDTPEAQNGLGCMSCHSITKVDSSMGNGGLTMEYPPLHHLASSKNPFIRFVDRFFTFANPQPHKNSFMKPFMRLDASEYCSSCHKVHLDIPVNDYRWFRGFNDYDNWQASGVSGQGARSFYYPPKSQTCVDCHMPLVASDDPGVHENSQLHSHRFPGANMAVPFANRDHAQMGTVERFLKSGFITVDIFSASPIDENAKETAMVRRAGGGEGPQLASMSAVGEESMQAGGGFIREVGKISAPIDRSGLSLQPGTTARVDVVVRTRKIGHFFPGGTLDSFDIWLELQARDSTGKTIFWSGQVTEDGKGPVEPGAHFYRAYQLDGEGNPINKRNAWQARSVLYVRAIPPGAADTVHYRVKIPKDAVGPITFIAKLNYRKFSWFYTNFSYAGQPKPGQEHLITKTHNSAEYEFSTANIPSNVSGKIRDQIPNLPIVVLAEATQQIPLGQSRWEPVVDKKDRERWNDWGIGLLLQGDLKGAEYAFGKVIEAEPEYADGYLNVARALIQEGQTDEAKEYIAQAMTINDRLARVYFFRALIEKADGDYDAALESLAIVRREYPRDRVVLNQMANIYYRKREFAKAIKVLEEVCLVDPEDVQMHYTAMLAHRGLGNTEAAAREEKLFRRFKAEESAQSITAKRRMISPEDNNERQTIHDHETVHIDANGIAIPAVQPKPPDPKLTQAPRRPVAKAAPAKTAVPATAAGGSER